jgi:hypothetical protein
MLFLIKNFGQKMKCETLHCCDATANSFVIKVLGEVFAHLHTVTIRRLSSVRAWLFALTG